MMPTFCGSWYDECDFHIFGPCGVHSLVAMRQRIAAILATAVANDDTKALLDEITDALVSENA